MKFDFLKMTTSALLIAVVVGFSSCKSNKKITEISETDDATEQTSMEETSDDNVQEDEEVLKPPVRTEPKKDAPTQLESFFDGVANAPSPASANRSISDALLMFSSPDAPVLIAIYSSGGQVDYDEPTTIKKYLEYLKDTGNYDVEVEEIVRDDSGKIKELVLRKR